MTLNDTMEPHTFMASPAQAVRIPLIPLIGVGVLVDWLAKQWVLANLLPAASVPVIPGILNLTRTHNTGAAFSLFQEHPVLLLVTVMLVLTTMTFYIARKPRLSPLETLGFAGVFAGALGNLLDRVVFGSVTDFIHLVGIHYPVFNVADILICMGVGLLMWHTLFGQSHVNSGH